MLRFSVKAPEAFQPICTHYRLCQKVMYEPVAVRGTYRILGTESRSKPTSWANLNDTGFSGRTKRVIMESFLTRTLTFFTLTLFGNSVHRISKRVRSIL